MAPSAPPARTLRLRITCPNFAAREATPTEFGVQDLRQVLHAGIAQADGTTTFEVAVAVVPHPADGAARYRGPFVHGTPSEPHLYLSLRPVGGDPGAWRRRIKVRFPVLTWEEVGALPETSILATYVSGERSRTVPLHTYAWTRQDAGAPT
jgi:hypothetical protein